MNSLHFSKFYTSFGAVISLILMLLLFVYAFYRLKVLWYYENSQINLNTFQRNLDHYPEVRNISEYGFDFAFKIQSFFGLNMWHPEYINAEVHQYTFKRVEVNGTVILTMDEDLILET